MGDIFYNIEIKNLSIGYAQSGRQPVILRKRINFSANHGEMVALIGSNGIGKSTLLRSLVGFQEYFEGDFTINCESFKNIPIKDRAKLISFVSTEIVKVQHDCF
jgi:iron complex transport system ATP-binding protein